MSNPATADGPSAAPLWVTAFLDFAPDHFDDGVAFWRDVTRYAVSPARGDAGELATLLPPEGDDYLRVQRLGSGPDRVHLDLHVPDPRAAADRATELGASEEADHGYVVMRSPGGLTFCLVSHPASRRPRPATWPDGHSSLLDQVCIDVPRSSYEAECAFWAALTGWEAAASATHPDFRALARPVAQPLRFLLQRLGEEDGDTRAHLDWATTDRERESARHRAAGAEVVGRFHRWTVLADPVGRRYCLTDRDPRTGMLR